MRRVLFILSLLMLISASAYASVFGSVRVIVHDPQHRPLQGAEIVVKSRTSDWKQTALTSDEGIADLSAIPIGDYTVEVSAKGFAADSAQVTVISGRLQELHAQLRVAVVQQNVTVTAGAMTVDTTSSTPQGTVSRLEIARTPGGDRANSLSFITDYVPGSYVVHDQLHVRGGHQVTWALDGVPLPNTNIASSVGPQFDPKDADYIEQERGAFSAESGDRTYGVFNVVPRSGFERNKQGELVLSYGSYKSTDSQLSFGDHSDRAAYYVSLSGNRSDYGLETVGPERLHDQAAGGSAFSSLQYNLTPKDQLRFVGGWRADFYQVPNDSAAQAAGVRDREREQDGFGIFTWAHTFDPSTLLTISPFFHFNRAAFEGGAADVPIATDNRASTYGGGQMALTVIRGKHNFKVGVYAFAQHDDHLFHVIANDGSGLEALERIRPDGELESYFVEDQYRPWQWMTLNLGVRMTRFAGSIKESSADPRLGIAIVVPKVGIVLRGAYSRYYQAPPLSTVSGPLLSFALAQGFDLLPLKGERDEQHNFGVTVPFRGWTLDADYFRTGARNFFDHDVLENSNIFFPLTIDRARVRGEEVALRAPQLFKKINVHLAYSHQTVEGEGGVSGGLTNFTPPSAGLFFLDHDQRNTLSAGFSADLPHRAWVASNISYGSGFLDGDGPAHLPDYYTWDFSVGKNLGEDWSTRFSATNLTEQRYFIDLSNTFGGSHYSDPRQVSVQVKYRFHY